MNIHTVRYNLKNTIEGKERMLTRIQECIRSLDALDDQGDSWFRATITAEFLTVNIDELKKILADVENCCEQAIEASWALNPERMGQ
jgi:hypothetical protein